MKKKQKKQSTKRTSEELLISAIKSQVTSRKRNPNVIKVITLKTALTKFTYDRLAPEVALVLSTKFTDRLQYERYMIAYNSTMVSSWDDIAVLQLNESITQFKHLVCINVEDINKEEFKTVYSVFINVVINELKMLGRIL